MIGVLLIDDNPDDRALVIRQLTLAFATVQITEVGTAAQFEAALATATFDVVITDYQLHWSNGIHILTTIKAHHPNCPVILFTSTATQEIAIEAMKLGLDDYVIKSPSHYVRLPAAIETVLERMTARQQAASLQARIQTLLNQLDIGVYRMSATGALLEGNPAFLRLLGLGKLTAVPPDQTLESYFQPSDYAELLAQLKQNGEVRNREIQLRCADGSSRWVNISKTFTQANNATLIDGLMEDITPRKQAEVQAAVEKRRSEFLADASQLLTASLDYHQVLNRIVQMAVPDLADWCFVDIAVGATVDFTKPVVAAITPEKKALVHELRRRYPPPLDSPYGPASVFRTGEPELVSDMPETIPLQVAQDEDHLNLLRQLQATSYMVVPMKVGDRILGTIAFASTRQALRYSQADLEMALELGYRAAIALDNARLYRDAQQANRAKDEFLAVVSHELRNPLNSILGWAQILQKRSFTDLTVTRAIESIARNAKLQNKLIEDLLDVSRIIQNRLVITRQPVYLVPIIHAVLETFQPNAHTKGVRLSAHLDPAVEQVSGDAHRLEQIVGNLLSNAIKFTPSGGRVEIRLATVGSWAQIIVSDTGQGIQPEFLPYIFERFRQADATKTRSQAGLGLGLAIVHHLVELHGGSVQVTSAGEGTGTTFTVQLPTLGSAHPPLEETMTTAQPSPTLTGLQILVVDDDLDNRELIAFILEQQAAQVTLAESAAVAFELMTQMDVDILITDIGMPGEDGYSLLQRIRNLPTPQKRDVPAIALTAFAKAEDEQQATAAGFQRHLAKPINPNNLVAAIASLAQPPNRKR